jgi:hypothetical protein
MNFCGLFAQKKNSMANQRIIAINPICSWVCLVITWITSLI